MSRIKTFNKIVIIKPSSLGDVVHSLPFLNAVKSCFSRAEIHWVLSKGLEGLLEGHPMVDRLITVRKDTWKKISKTGETIKEVSQLYRRIRDERYDLAIDLQGLLRSGIITMATRAPVRIGFAEGREGSTVFYNRKVRGGKNIHAVDRYLRVAAELGCRTEDVLFPFPLMKHHLDSLNEFKKGHKDYVVIIPGARWDTKIWPAENFGKVAAQLSWKSFIVGGKEDIPIAEKVVDSSDGKAVSLAGKTSLGQLIEILRGARLVISNDSGPMHIAAGLHVPVIALFGPTSPLMTGPYGKGHVIIKADIQCSPCFKKRCGHVKCMEEISVEHVHEKIQTAFST